MSILNKKITESIEKFKANNTIDKLEKDLSTEMQKRLPVPHDQQHTKQGQDLRLEFLENQTRVKLDSIGGRKIFSDHSQLKANIENFIGMAQIPVGVIGPVRVNGSAAGGDYYVPLATTEGALVASYNRGARACYSSGGTRSVCILQGIQRSPLFTFNNLPELGKFVVWVSEQLEKFRQIVSDSSRFAILTEMSINIEGNNLILTFEYTTGDAAGQNMITFCTEAICNYIIEHVPVKPTAWFVESNYSGDKKATTLSFSDVRGKKVVTEITLPRAVVESVLKTTPEKMKEYCALSTNAALQSGSIGAQGHIANGLAAIFIACGQDTACVSEAAMGITRFDVTKKGDLYASLTIPNLVVGTVGGGTHLPTQRECLELMDCYGAGNAVKFAEICASMLLAGELSIVAALTSHTFSSAHKLLGRK